MTEAIFTKKYLNSLAKFVKTFKADNYGNLARYEISLDLENRLMNFLAQNNPNFSRDKWVKATAVPLE